MYINKKKVGGVLLLMFFATIVLVALYKKHQFLKNYQFTTGRVTEITPPGYKSSGDYSVLYEYMLNGTTYHNNTNRNYCRGLGITKVKLLLTGKKFTVAYSSSDYGISSIILTQDDAETFHDQLPDSVKFYDSVLTCRH